MYPVSTALDAFPVDPRRRARHVSAPISGGDRHAAVLRDAEQLLIETLAADYVDFEAFDERVIRLRDELLSLLVPRKVVLDAAARRRS